MPRLVAFLRAVNVGGHVVKMERLRALFVELGFKDVETFIASGNVIFASPSSSVKALEKRIQDRLSAALAYDVTTFVRTDAQVAAVATYKPFSESRMKSAAALYVGFLAQAPRPAARKAVMALGSDIDDFHVRGPQLYWLSRTGMGQSKLTSGIFERALQGRVTFRQMSSVQKLAAGLAQK